MKYIDEYRDKGLALQLSEQIKKISRHDIALMEVCGGHTMAVQKFGIPSLLPSTVRLLSGPGCPVCVSSIGFIDKAVAYSRKSDVIITTFGDLIRVPGSTSSLDKEKANGADVRIVYSILEAINIAKKNPEKKVIFLGIGFETTSPGNAAGMLLADKEQLRNFFLFSAHKIIPPAMEALIEEGVNINGYICPGHVSVITGSAIYKGIPEKYGLGCVISGFEPLDILQSIYMLVEQYEVRRAEVAIQYKRAVRPEGNLKAKRMLTEVFTLRDDWWRGLGTIPASGLVLRDTYKHLDAEIMIPVEVEESREPEGCICGEILKGLKTPFECKLFGKACHPSNPVGACMVSNEGACQAYFRYKKYG